MRTLSWSLYLACSWTWCIGMWLPTLLVRDQGTPGFLAFFIPNVIGAASVGWLLAGRAQRFYDTKRPIILAFTAVTIAFHAYWILTRFAEPLFDITLELVAGAAVGASLVLNAIALTKKPRGLAAAVTLLISLAAAVGLAANPAAVTTAATPLDLAGLAAVCALGFALCPYLDLTFNKAAIESKRPRLIFTLGFTVFGLIILAATRGRTLWADANPAAGALTVDLWTLSLLVGGHFGAQATFTCAAHVEALKTTAATRILSAEGLRLTVFPILAALAVAALVIALPVAAVFGMATEEIGYRTFLAAYGLVFPAWLLLALGNRPAAHPRTLIALAAVCAPTTPFLAYGFIALDYAWVLPGVALLPITIPLARKTLVPQATPPATL